MVRKLFFLCAWLFVSFTLWAQGTGERTLSLQWKFKAGEKFTYENQTDMVIQVTSPLQNMDGKFKIFSVIAFHVKKVDDAGVATIEGQIKRIRGSFSMGPLQQSFDSDKQQDLNSPLPPQFGGMSLKDLLKKKVSFTVDPSGKVQFKNAQQSNVFKQLRDIFVNFPMGPVPLGSSWTQQTSENMMGNNINAKIKYVLKGVESKKDGDYARIDRTIEFDLDLSNHPLGKQMKIEVKKNKGSGSILFHLQEGKIRKMEGKLTLHYRFSGQMGEQNMEMEQKVIVSQTLTLKK